MNLPIKKTNFVVFFSGLCFIVLRALQLFFCIDSRSGFFKKNLASMGTELSVLIFVFLAFSVLFSLSEKKVPKGFPKTSLSLCVSYIILSVFLILDLIFLPSTFPSQIIQLVIYYFSGILSVLLLLYLGVSYLFDIPFLKEIKLNPLVFLVTVVFWIIRTVICFSSYTEMAVLSENVFLIIAFLSVLFLLLYFAFLICDVTPLKAARRMLPLYILALLSSSTFALPPLLIKIAGFSERLHSLNINHITFLGVFVFLLVLYFNMFSEENLKDKPQKRVKEKEIFKH